MPSTGVTGCDARASGDVSPKGDPRGFVHVLDDTTIVVPERPGNRRAGDRIVTSGRIDHDEIRAAADPGHFLVQARRCHQAERDMPRRGQINLPPACRGFAIVEIACHGLLAGIKVNRCNAVAGALQRNRSMHRRRRLSRAALFIGEDNYVRVLRHRC